MQRFEEAKKQYNAIMFDIGCEFVTIGTNFSENTETWTLRDMVSEAQYHLNCCYEEGNANAEAKSVRFLMDAYGMDRDIAEADHAAWLDKTRKLRAFVRKYKKEALALDCVTGHCSEYDNKKTSASEAAETAQDATSDDSSTDDQASTENSTEAAKTAEEWAAESERVHEAVSAWVAQVFPAAEEAKETQENTEPEYLDERWPESNQEPGVWYSIDWETGVPTIYSTAADFRTAVHQAQHNGRQIEAAWRHDGNTWTRRAIIPETSQEKTDRENREHCRRIAEELEAYAAGDVYKCPECGQIHAWEDIEETEHEDGCGWAVYTCPDCGAENREDDWEQLSLYDFFADCLDIEYRCGSDKEYRSVSIMVSCGGPNIYIDTEEKAVLLYWWTDRARYYLSSDAVDAVDDWAREYWECL